MSLIEIFKLTDERETALANSMPSTVRIFAKEFNREIGWLNQALRQAGSDRIISFRKNERGYKLHGLEMLQLTLYPSQSAALTYSCNPAVEMQFGTAVKIRRLIMDTLFQSLNPKELAAARDNATADFSL